MPCGLKNADATFQRAMDDAPEGQDNVRDHVLVFSRTFDEHLKHLEQVFQEIGTVGLKSHPSKCTFGADEVHYLGHALSVKEMSP